MMRWKARADQGDFPGRRFVHGELAVGALKREHLRRWMLRALFAKGRIVRRTNPRGKPHAPLLVEHRIVHAVLLAQIISSPQYGEGAVALSLDDGVFGSRTGILTCVALCFFGFKLGQGPRVS